MATLTFPDITVYRLNQNEKVQVLNGNAILANGVERLATISYPTYLNWTIVDGYGRFDSSNIEEVVGLNWVLFDEPLRAYSVEIFMRDYYEPNLLPRLLQCNEENSCEQEFKPVRNLTELNRTQPNVKITNIKPTDAADVVQVTVEAEDVKSEFQKDKQNQPLHSGVFDLRLFRDGQLVSYSTADEKLQATFKTYKDSGEELKVWQAANKVELVNGKRLLLLMSDCRKTVRPKSLILPLTLLMPIV